MFASLDPQTYFTRKMTNFKRSETPSCMDHYVAALFLPHTDMNCFPKLKARLHAASIGLQPLRK
jgi:hypothetical protein